MNASLYSSSCQRPATSAGFTLIELMVTITVLAIIVSIAAPNISNQLANQRVKSTASTIENALKEAKAESIIRRQSVTVSINNSSSPKVIELKDSSLKVITSYDYDANSTIKQLPTTAIVFEPSKRVTAAVTYTLCDKNTSVTPRQIEVNAIATITRKVGGTCP